MTKDLNWAANDFGYSGWSYDPINIDTGGNLATGQIIVSEIKIMSDTISQVSFFLQNESVVELISGQNFIGIYDEKNRLLGKTFDLTSILSKKGTSENVTTVDLENTIFLRSGVEKVKVAVLINKKPETSPPAISAHQNTLYSRSFATLEEGITSLPNNITELRKTGNYIWFAVN